MVDIDGVKLIKEPIDNSFAFMFSLLDGKDLSCNIVRCLYATPAPGDDVAVCEVLEGFSKRIGFIFGVINSLDPNLQNIQVDTDQDFDVLRVLLVNTNQSIQDLAEQMIRASWLADPNLDETALFDDILKDFTHTHPDFDISNASLESQTSLTSHLQEQLKIELAKAKALDDYTKEKSIAWEQARHLPNFCYLCNDMSEASGFFDNIATERGFNNPTTLPLLVTASRMLIDAGIQQKGGRGFVQPDGDGHSAPPILHKFEFLLTVIACLRVSPQSFGRVCSDILTNSLGFDTSTLECFVNGLCDLDNTLLIHHINSKGQPLFNKHPSPFTYRDSDFKNLGICPSMVPTYLNRDKT